MNTERKLARVVVIDDVQPIEGADSIDVATVGGWKVVVKRGIYTKGSLACYVEIDAWVPHSIAPFLTDTGKLPKVYNEVPGQRLRSKKLRKVVSQGLLLPLEVVGDAFVNSKFDDDQEYGEVIYKGADVTDILGIQRWEPPQEFLPANAKGSFPNFIPKTAQERLQNLSTEFQQWKDEGHEWQITEKLDGSSMTVFYNNGEVGVCSRNLELKEDQGNTFWDTARKYNLVQKLISYGKNIAVQGELIGGNIQGNAYKIDGFRFYVYDVYDIDKQEYMLPEDAEILAEYFELLHVPIISCYTAIPAEIDLAAAIKDADGSSQVGCKPKREGLVYKSTEVQGVSFKVIGNAWLLKNE